VRVAGLEALGKNGARSRFQLPLDLSCGPDIYIGLCERIEPAGTALFTQPPIAIKCAGAPPKGDVSILQPNWEKEGVLANIDVASSTIPGAALFGIKEYVPSLDGIYRPTTTRI